MSDTKRMIGEMIKIILKDANDKREGAGYSGSFGDGGASKLEDQVRFYNYGREGVVPPEWKEYEKKVDPEYQEYMRLKDKFKGI